MARWRTADPSGFPDGANSYDFLSNSPQGSVDYQGFESVKIPLTGTTLTFGKDGIKISQELPGRVKNSTQDDLNVTFKISGDIELDATAIVTGAKVKLTFEESIDITVKPKYSGWIVANAGFDKTKWDPKNPAAAFNATFEAKTAE